MLLEGLEILKNLEMSKLSVRVKGGFVVEFGVV